MTNLKTSIPLCLLLVLFIPPSTLGQEKKSLRVVFVSLSWNNQLHFRIAIAKGFFKDQGLAVEPIFVRGGPTALAALISGDVEFASVGGAQAPIRSRAKGLDVHIIGLQSNYTNYTLLGSKQVQKPRRAARQDYRRHRRGRFFRFCHQDLSEKKQPGPG
jgi:NitT/TauT family transport system substrate-binding protein